MGERRQKRSGTDAENEPPKPRLLASWQQALIWAVWLAFILAAGYNSDRGSMSLFEFAMLGAAIATTVICKRNPMGGQKFVFSKTVELEGEFVSRANWPLVLFGCFLTLVGVAAACKITYDLFTGAATIGAVLADIATFVLEWTMEVFSKGSMGDVTQTRMYALIFLLIPGPILTWFTLQPWLERGSRFYVNKDGSILIRMATDWTPLPIEGCREVIADGDTIRFFPAKENDAEIKLPQARVYSLHLKTRVGGPILGRFFREYVEKRSFILEDLSSRSTATKWRAAHCGINSRND